MNEYQERAAHIIRRISWAMFAFFHAIITLKEVIKSSRAKN